MMFAFMKTQNKEQIGIPIDTNVYRLKSKFQFYDEKPGPAAIITICLYSSVYGAVNERLSVHSKRTFSLRDFVFTSKAA
jgi:hypothetical protein